MINDEVTNKRRVCYNNLSLNISPISCESKSTSIVDFPVIITVNK